MENNVIISIRGQQMLDQDEETVELVTEGRLDGDGAEGFTLSYQESALTGMGETLTTFQIEKHRITLLRIGEFNSQMVFEEGRRHMAMYNTPYGALSVGVNTRRMHADLEAGGGSIDVLYALDIDHAAAGQNRFQISVREKKPALLQ